MPRTEGRLAVPAVGAIAGCPRILSTGEGTVKSGEAKNLRAALPRHRGPRRYLKLRCVPLVRLTLNASVGPFK